jgi:hypothetical protein
MHCLGRLITIQQSIDSNESIARTRGKSRTLVGVGQLSITTINL